MPSSASASFQMSTTAVRRLDLLIEQVQRVGAADLAAVGLGKREVGEDPGHRAIVR